MGILDSIFDSVGGVFADQWKDIITAGPFDEHTVVAPGVRKDEQNGRGGNQGSEDVISNGSLLFVPENTAAFVYSQAGIECIITEPGGFAYRNGELSVFDYESLNKQGAAGLLQTAALRVAFSGLSPQEKRVAFVNLREIRGLKFGTRGPLVYNMARDFWTRHRLSKEKPLSSPTSEGKGGERPCRRGESRTRRTRRTSSPNA